MRDPRAGDHVTLLRLPPWVSDLPERSASVFRACLGHTYEVTGIDEHGHLVLDVSTDIDARFDGAHHDIRVEPAYVRMARDEEGS